VTPRVPDIGTLSPAEQVDGAVLPVVVSRVAGVPVAALDDLLAPETLDAVARADAAGTEALRLADRLADGLHALVPLLPEPVLRRTAIALRRDVHNGRWSDRSVRGVALLGPHLLPAVGHDLAAWRSVRELHHAAEDAAAACFAAEVSRAAKALQHHLCEPTLAAGLALSSPVFTRRLLGSPLPDEPWSRAACTATAYLTRVAVKTSPSSTLTTVAASGWGAERRSRGGTGSVRWATPGDTGKSDLRSARPVAAALLLACVWHPQAVRMLDVTVAHGLRRLGDRWFAVLPIRTVAGRTAVRLDELTECTRYAHLVQGLPDTAVPWDDCRALVARRAGEDEGLPRRLLEVGLLQPVAPWQLGAGCDFDALASWARDRLPRGLAALAAALDELREQELRVVVRDASERCAAVTVARGAIRDAFGALGSPVPAWLAELPLFHEVSAAGPAQLGESPALPPTVREDLATSVRWLAPHTWRSPVYDELVRCFINRHGCGATGVELLDFLYAFLVGVDAAALTRLAPRIDRATAADPARLCGYGTAASASYALFFQVAAAGPAQVATGQHRTVINAVHSGGFGLVARWAGLPTVCEVLAGPLAAWQAALHPACTTYQVCAAADWTDLQRPALPAVPRLRCPGDLADGTASSVLPAFTVAHDPASGTLQVADGNGHPVAFACGGATPPHLLHGVPRLLCLLSNPWTVIGRVDRDRNLWDDGGRAEVVVHPRVTRERIVWARARWSFPVRDVPTPNSGRSALGALADVLRWQEAHGLPEEVFVTAVGRRGGRVVKQKPQWLGMRHPHTIWGALGRLGDDVETVDVVEALPSRSEHWLRDAEGRPRVTEQLGMVRCA
jgi:hypothetical protein